MIISDDTARVKARDKCVHFGYAWLRLQPVPVPVPFRSLTRFLTYHQLSKFGDFCQGVLSNIWADKSNPSTVLFCFGPLIAPAAHSSITNVSDMFATEPSTNECKLIHGMSMQSFFKLTLTYRSHQASYKCGISQVSRIFGSHGSN